MPPSKSMRTIAQQLITFVFIGMFLVFLASTIITRILYRNTLLSIQLENMRHLAHEEVHQVDGLLDKVMVIGRSAVNLFHDKSISISSFESYLEQIIRDNACISSAAYVLEPEAGGRPYLFYKMSGGVRKRLVQNDTFRYLDWYQMVILTGKPHWIEPWFENEGPGVTLISYAMPIYEKGRIKGVLRLDMTLDYLRETIHSYSGSRGFEGFFVSSTGTLISFPDPALVMNHTLFSLAQEYHDPDIQRLGAAMINGEIGHLYLKGSSPLAYHWIYYYPLKKNQWSVAVTVKQQEIMRPVNLVIWIQTMAYVLIFIIVALIIYARVVNVSRPLRLLAKAAGKIGLGDFDAKLPESDRSFEIHNLSQSFANMQKSLKEYIENLKTTTEEKQKIEGEVFSAVEIQTKLIPKNSEHPFDIKELRAYGILEPAGDIGGDLYDYFMMDDEHFCFVIADVLGKGIVAAMSMAMISTFLPSMAPYHKSPSTLLQALNVFLCEHNADANFVTIFLGVLDIESGILEYSNCGHVPMLIRKIDRSFKRYHETHATALGVFEALSIGSERLQLDKGDEIILFTDGVTEAQNKEEEFLGMQGLEEIVGQLSNLNPKQSATFILDEVRKFAEGSGTKDDITLLVIDYKKPVMFSDQ